MYHKTRGVVLHTIKYSETSVIAKIYTEKLGLQSYIVKGVRASKSKSKAAMLQPLTLLEMEVSHRENKHLQYIKEFSRAFVYKSIPFDTLKSTFDFFLLYACAFFFYIYFFFFFFSLFLGFAPHGNYSEVYSVFEMSEGVFTDEPDTLNVLTKKESRLLSELRSEER